MRDWSYYGAAHRFDVHHDMAAEQCCTKTMRELREAGDEDGLRREGDAGHDFMWLVSYLSDGGRLDDALSALEDWASKHPDLDRLAHARRLDLLVKHGRGDEVRRAAESGDRTAARRIRGLQDE